MRNPNVGGAEAHNTGNTYQNIGTWIHVYLNIFSMQETDEFVAILKQVDSLNKVIADYKVKIVELNNEADHLRDQVQVVVKERRLSDQVSNFISKEYSIC